MVAWVACHKLTKIWNSSLEEISSNACFLWWLDLSFFVYKTWTTTAVLERQLKCTATQKCCEWLASFHCASHATNNETKEAYLKSMKEGCAL